MTSRVELAKYSPRLEAEQLSSEPWLVKAIPSSRGLLADRDVRGIKTYRISQSTPTSESLIDAEWRQERAQNRAKGRRLKADHRRTYETRLRRIQADLRRESLSTLLSHLSADFGMSWVDIGRFVDVSVPALRKWRSGGGIAADKLEQVLRLGALLQLLKELGVADPAMWSTGPIVHGYLGSPLVFVQEGHELVVLDLAAGNVSPEQAFDELDPMWRTSRKAAYKVVDGPDGSRLVTDA